jgi:hypothetical protein
MLLEWEDGQVGNNPGIVAGLPRKPAATWVVMNLVRGRRAPVAGDRRLPSAA